MNIILIGYRGSGKTTLGKQLAMRQWMKFVDLDEEVRKKFDNRSIADIWKTDGEKAFRETEVRAIEEVCRRSGQVVALGGGSLMEPAARRAVMESPGSVRIYLYCSPEELFKRLSLDDQTAANRPALTKLGGSLDEIRQVMADREPIYRAVADKVFDVTNLDAEKAVRYLIERCL